MKDTKVRTAVVPTNASIRGSPQPAPATTWSAEVVEHKIVHGTLVLTLAAPLLGHKDELLALSGSIGGVWFVNHIAADGFEVWCGSNSSSVAAKLTATDTDVSSIFAWEVTPLFPGQNDVLQPKSADAPCRCRFHTPLVLHSRISILNLYSIDTVAQTFSADVAVSLRLRQIARQGVPQAWTEELVACVGLTDTAIELLHVVSYDDDVFRSTSFESSQLLPTTMCDLVLFLRVRGTFLEQLELDEFPFDQQSFSLVLAVNVRRSHVILRSNYISPSVFQVANFQRANVFHATSRKYVLTRHSFSDPRVSSSGGVYPRMEHQILLARKSGFYIANILVPTATITYLGFLSFGVDVGGQRMDTASRVSISLTLMLTAVAYKFTVAGMVRAERVFTEDLGAIPQISYLTSLDMYVNLSFATLGIISIENVLFPWICTQDCYATEQLILCALLALFTLGNLVWCFVVARTLRARRHHNELLLERHRLNLLIAKQYPNISYKDRDHMFDLLVAEMHLELPEAPSRAQFDGRASERKARRYTAVAAAFTAIKDQVTEISEVPTRA
ncbi:hypothetical protein ACHHYP_13945 [Achlya hypogyna]|uniref:Neurotransmitter-gated ion-channel ligand-binding domain-containing protein n=1 Tax=Achlya hypogyna TaxID=1202772 RepID=A0A1V9YEF5_ACHHY|nr:hypothetical protein ACHHYP_13945 [Achlya hypogyna]